jgi:hypothetical protein
MVILERNDFSLNPFHETTTTTLESEKRLGKQNNRIRESF